MRMTFGLTEEMGAAGLITWTIQPETRLRIDLERVQDFSQFEGPPGTFTAHLAYGLFVVTGPPLRVTKSQIGNFES